MLFKAGIWSLIDKIFLSSASVLSPIILALMYSPNEYGEYIYAFTVASLISMVVVFVDDKVVKNKFGEEKNDNLLILAGKIRLFIIITASFLYLVLFLTGLISFEGINISFVFLVHYTIVGFTYKFTIKLEYYLDTKILAICNLSSTMVLLIIQLAIGWLQLEIVYCAYVFVFAALLKLVLLYFLNQRPIKPLAYYHKNFSLVKDIIHESLPFGFAAAASLIYMRMDTLMIEHFMTKEDVGVYSFAVQMVTICGIVLVPIQTVIFPKMRDEFHASKTKYNEMFTTVTSLSVVSYTIITIIVYIIFNFIIHNFNTEYLDSLIIFLILSSSGFLISMSVLRSLHFILSQLGRYLLVIQIVALLINFVLNSLFIPLHGLAGGAISTVISQFISLFLSNFAFKELRIISFIQISSLNFFNLKNLKNL